jgi:hypothetical protein
MTYQQIDTHRNSAKICLPIALWSSRADDIAARFRISFSELAIGDRECYCIPYSNLCEFYNLIGFQALSETCAPSFLQNRLEVYCRKGHNVTLMKRPDQKLTPRAARLNSSR